MYQAGEIGRRSAILAPSLASVRRRRSKSPRRRPDRLSARNARRGLSGRLCPRSVPKPARPGKRRHAPASIPA